MEEKRNVLRKILRYLFALASIVLVLSIVCPIMYKITKESFYLYATLICLILDGINVVAISYIWETTKED